MQKDQTGILKPIVILITAAVAFTIGAVLVISGREPEPVPVPEYGITWETKEDGTRVFSIYGGARGSTYSWALLDEDGKTVEKTGYSAATAFTPETPLDASYTVKCFIKSADGETQTSMFLSAADVLGRTEYALDDIPEAEDVEAAIRVFMDKLHQDISLPTSEETLSGVCWGEDISLPLDWTCADVEDRNTSFQISAMRFLPSLYEAWEETGEEFYPVLIKDYMLDFVRSNPTVDAENVWVWHDDGTAWRVLTMSFYTYKLEDWMSKEERKEIRDSLAMQAQLLLNPTFYTNHHNHGLHQDMALLTYGLLVDDSPEQEKYLAAALSRIGDYAHYSFAEDGVHKEHSPYYGWDVYLSVCSILDIAQELSSDFCEDIGGLMSGFARYAVAIIEPDMTWPSLGDSIRRTRLTDLAVLPGYEYASTRGASGEEPETDSLFTAGGYAVFRSSWKDSAQDATWMLLAAATHSSTHKHSDDLEVLLYHKGELFVEGGKRDYNYSDPVTAWVYSGYAHNVLLVDGEDFPVNVGDNGFRSILEGAKETGIVSGQTSDSFCSATASQQRFPGIVQKRTLSYDKTAQTVRIEDVITADRDFEGTLLWHVAEGVQVTLTEDGAVFSRNGEEIAAARITADVPVTWELVTGEGEDPYHTWIFEGQEEARIGSLLIVKADCGEGTSAVCMELELK